MFEGPYRFSIGRAMHAFDISPDGEQFLMLKEAEGTSATVDSFDEDSIVVIQNWFEELTRLVPTP